MNNRRDVRPETDGREETGGTGQCGTGVRRHGEIFDTVPREMAIATIRLMGVQNAEVKMVEGTYEKTTARVVVGEGASDEFEVKIGLRQGSVLIPLLFIAVMDLISRKTVVQSTWPWWRMTNKSYRRHWKSGRAVYQTRAEH